MECPNCHQQVIETAERCGYCGWQLKANKPSAVPYSQQVTPQTPLQQRMPVAPVSYPPAPDYQKKKKKKAGWVWFLVIAVLLIAAILVIVLATRPRSLSYANYPQNGQADSSNSSAPADQASPPEQPADTNPGASAAPPEAPADTAPDTQGIPASSLPEVAQAQAPDPLNELINGWYIETSYIFDTLSNEAWSYTDGKVYPSNEPSNPLLVMDARDGYLATLSSTFQLYPGSAILMQFSPAENADFEAFLAYGDTQASDYRRFGIGFANYSVVMNNWRGTSTLDSGTDITGQFDADDSGYYMLLIAIDQEGTAKAQVWDVYDPGNKSNITSFNGGITDLTWTFTVNVGQGALIIPYINILYFDMYN